jgi:hypothetical protein
MFVVHTVSVLAEALKCCAMEILVIGALSKPVQAVCRRKSIEGNVDAIQAVLAEEILGDISEIIEMCGVPAWERDSMLSLIRNYSVVGCQVNTATIPSVTLKRTDDFQSHPREKNRVNVSSALPRSS